MHNQDYHESIAIGKVFEVLVNGFFVFFRF